MDLNQSKPKPKQASSSRRGANRAAFTIGSPPRTPDPLSLRAAAQTNTPLPSEEEMLADPNIDGSDGEIRSARISNGLADAGANEFSTMYPLSQRARDSLEVTSMMLSNTSSSSSSRGVLRPHQREPSEPPPMPKTRHIGNYPPLEQSNVVGHSYRPNPLQQQTQKPRYHPHDGISAAIARLRAQTLDEEEERGRPRQRQEGFVSKIPVPKQIGTTLAPQPKLHDYDQTASSGYEQAIKPEVMHPKPRSFERAKFIAGSDPSLEYGTYPDSGSHYEESESAGYKQPDPYSNEQSTQRVYEQPTQNVNQQPKLHAEEQSKPRVHQQPKQHIPEQPKSNAYQQSNQQSHEQSKAYGHEESNADGDRHFSQSSQQTTVTDLMHKANAPPQQEAPQLEPALPIHAKQRLAPIDVDSAERYGKMTSRNRDAQAVRGSPGPEEVQKTKAKAKKNNKSPVYSSMSMNFPDSVKVSPLHVPTVSGMQRERYQANILEGYFNWQKRNKERNDDEISPTGAVRSKSATGERRIQRNIETEQDQDMAIEPASPKEARGLPKSFTMADVERVRQTEPYTPLTAWLERESEGKKGTKTMLGQNGWLENNIIEGQKKQPPKKPGFLGNMKKLAREFYEKADLIGSRPTNNARTVVNKMSISLDPRPQSLVYCELEYTLNQALDTYIKAQFNRGRVDMTKLKRVADAWSDKGRPRVVGFQYDVETQIDLIIAHMVHRDFRFYGPQADDIAVVQGLLHAIKVDAREMRVRTFCYPDSVISKHITDAQKLLQLLGARSEAQVTLARCAEFYRDIVQGGGTDTEKPKERARQDSAVDDAYQQQRHHDNYPAGHDQTYRSGRDQAYHQTQNKTDDRAQGHAQQQGHYQHQTMNTNEDDAYKTDRAYDD